ncbi:hypothetical protein BC835DRAFT_1253857, partial [Cytidiella melzeri]
DIICAVNTQHNCTDSDSQYIGVTLHPTRQERTFTEHRTKQIAQHADTPHFLLNIYSIHNYYQIAKALPSSLRRAEPVIPDTAVLEVRKAA